MNKRDASIELLRIIATLMVIGTHIKVGGLESGSPDYARTLVSCFVGDGVAIFWCIMGFYFFSGPYSYKKRVNKLLKRIIFPMIIYYISMFYLYDYLMGNATLKDSLYHSIEEYKYILYNTLIVFQPVQSCTEHLWYLFVYVLVVLCFPILYGIKDYIDKKNSFQVLIVFFVLLVINDLSLNKFMEITHHSFRGVLGAVLWIVIGYILRGIIDKYKEKFSIKMVLICVASFIGLNTLRAYVQYKLYFADSVTELPICWFSSFSFLSVLCLFVIAFGIKGVINMNVISNVINYVGLSTFGIYLIHMLVYSVLIKKNICSSLLAHYSISGTGVIKYEVVLGLLIFSISFLLVTLFSLIKLTIKKLIDNKERVLE